MLWTEMYSNLFVTLPRLNMLRIIAQSHQRLGSDNGPYVNHMGLDRTGLC